MQTLRSALFLVFQIVTVVPYALCCLLLAPAPRRIRYRFTVGWPRLVVWGAKVFTGIRWQVKGAHNLPEGPAIVLAKHQSTWETLFLAAWMPREMCFVFKRELLRLPFFGWGIGLLDMIHIDRKRRMDAFEQVVEQGARKLDEGRWIILFPEGTRTPAGSQGRYRSGGARLAVRTGAPVIPIAVNSGEFWPRRAIVLRPGTITVSIGPPIPVTGRAADEVNAEVETWIEGEMRKLSPHLYPAAFVPVASASGRASARRQRSRA